MYVPTATYRLQFGPSFGFKDAEAIVPYLHDLGISDIYASPVFKANKGSKHGYDLTNPSELNPELGSAEDFSSLTAKRGEYNIGWIQDIVPNHMAYSSDNRMLMDIFKNGRNSRYADFFDIFWDHPDESLRGKILAPFLGKPYSVALADGEIQLEWTESGLAVRYYDIRFPLAVSSYSRDESQKDMPAPGPLLDKQFFKLCFWKRAAEVINYRRFFYLNAFIGLKVENPKVFSEIHKLIAHFVRRGVFTGLRVDHIDGLYDPAQYLARLRQLAGDKYIIVEKILDLDESLSEDWPVQGTTGYDFCNYVNGIFIAAENEQLLTETYRQLVNRSEQYDELLIEKKRAVCERYMSGEIDNLVHLFATAAQNYQQEVNLKNIRQALIEIICAFTVYRTYVSNENCRDDDRDYIKKAIDVAKSKNPALTDAIDQVGRVLLPDSSEAENPSAGNKSLDWIMKFQQLTGPVMAKGFEDTLLYNYNRLVGLNEVGSRPDRFGVSLDEFHKFNAAKAARWPHGLNATSTHDIKRGEDVRARIAVLSEMPELWSEKVRLWRQTNLRFKSDCHGLQAPDDNDEYLLYQTLIGALPFDPDPIGGFKQRIKQYMTKAVREAKEHSSWIEPHEQYEQACGNFIDCILDPTGSNEFWSDFLPFQKRIAAYGIFNSLSQTLLKMTSPGVPDFYQGSELWDLNLVDPDNRRPVDFEKRRKFLDEMRSRGQNSAAELIDELLQRRRDGRIKLFLVFKVLNARRKNAELFAKGDYQPLKARGKYGGSAIVFLRHYGDKAAVTVAPRFLKSLIDAHELPLGTDVWQDTEIRLPASLEGDWQDVITGETVQTVGAVREPPSVVLGTPYGGRLTVLRLGRLLEKFPVSLLIRG
jgi:(1->4)-alpha-D-glucan 1-alpha-D-glucosylmutase